MTYATAESFTTISPQDWARQTDGPFLLRGKRPIYAPRLAEQLPAGPLTTLAERVSRAFAEPQHDGCPDMLVGAIPYDRSGDDALFRPRWIDERIPAGLAAPTTGHWQVRGEPDVEGYKRAVSRALEVLGDDLPKVVLSRSLCLEGDQTVDLGALLASLAGDPAVAAFVTPLPPQGDMARHMVGATPELLVSRRGRAVESNPLAGSLPRLRAATADEAAAAMLTGQDKDRREHALVVEAVADALSPYCAELTVPMLPSVQSTNTMWHLGTRIFGQLKDDTPVAELLAALHPTPAICGAPRDKADHLLRRLEGYDRGFYAGAVGWLDASGDGDWYITLRCAEVSGNRLRMFAGAGIVAGSVPQCEAVETSAKFLAMLRALGVNEDGIPLSELRA